MTDALACIYPVGLTFPLQMPLKVKCQVILAFAFRLPAIGLSALHLAMIVAASRSSKGQFSATNPLLTQQALLIWSIISTTVPNLGGFMRSFATGFGIPKQMASGNQHSNGVYALQTIGGRSVTGGVCSNHRKNRETRQDAQGSNWDGSEQPALRPDVGLNETVVHSDGGDDHAVHKIVTSETDTQELIIKIRVDWRVHRD